MPYVCILVCILLHSWIWPGYLPNTCKMRTPCMHKGIHTAYIVHTQCIPCTCLAFLCSVMYTCQFSCVWFSPFSRCPLLCLGFPCFALVSLAFPCFPFLCLVLHCFPLAKTTIHVVGHACCCRFCNCCTISQRFRRAHAIGEICDLTPFGSVLFWVVPVDCL